MGVNHLVVDLAVQKILRRKETFGVSSPECFNVPL